MSDINKIAVKITGDESGLKKATKAAQKDIKAVGESALSMNKLIKGAALGSAIGNMLAGAFSNISRMISNEVNAAFKRFDALNNYSKVMGNLRVGTEDSSTSIAILDQKLRGLPTSLSDAALGVQRFTAANNNIKASTDMFLAFNNAILAGGAATETQATGMEQLIQAYSKGKADAQEWRAMLIAMPAQLKQIAEAMGYTSTAIGGDFQTALNTGKISMNDFALTAIKLNKQGANGFASFAEQAKNATGGVQTAITNMKIAIQRGIANILQELGRSNVAGFFTGISNAIGTATNYIAAFIRIIKQAIAWISALFGWGGKGSTESVVQATETASDALVSASEGAAGTAAGLDSAAGAAKKLRQQLAGFDEMNVLQDKDTSSGSGSGSGGSGGGGTTAIIDYEWDTSGLAEGNDIIDEIVKKIKAAFKNAFGEWDFDKIGKALQKFANRVKKFLEPIGKIAGDIWTKYLAPFISWAGNSLLPGFLEAVGGALEAIGSVLGRVWGSFLEPFITNFLKPIAEFTGGIIVDVLNGIGAALSWIGGNQTAVDILSSIVAAIGVLIGYNIVAGFITGLINALGILNTTFMALPIALSSTTIGFNSFTKAGAAASTIVNTLGAGTANLINSFTGAAAGSQLFVSSLGGLAISLGAITALILAFKLAAEASKLAEMEAAAAAAEYDARIFDETETMYALNDAVQAQIDLKNELKGLEESLANQSMALLKAQDNLTKAQTTAEAIAKKYGMTTDEAREMVDNLDIASGGLTKKERELADAFLDLESKEGAVREATEKVTESKKKQAEASQNLYNQALKEWGMAKLQENQALVNEGRYEELADKLVELSQATVEYTDENGKQLRISQEDVKNYTDLIGNFLGKLDTDNSRVWASIWSTTSDSVDNIKQRVQDFRKAMEQAGYDCSEGLRVGIQSRRAQLMSEVDSMANQISRRFNQALQIHSPSKVFAESGKWIDAGLAKGIEDNADMAIGQAEDLGTAMVDAFNTAPKFRDLGSLDIADQFGELTARAQGTLELQNEATNGAIDQLAQAISNLADKDQRVVVKIGEETLIDKIVDGINGASRMRNQTVLNL